MYYSDSHERHDGRTPSSTWKTTLSVRVILCLIKIALFLYIVFPTKCLIIVRTTRTFLGSEFVFILAKTGQRVCRSCVSLECLLDSGRVNWKKMAVKLRRMCRLIGRHSQLKLKVEGLYTDVRYTIMEMCWTVKCTRNPSCSK